MNIPFFPRRNIVTTEQHDIKRLQDSVARLQQEVRQLNHAAYLIRHLPGAHPSFMEHPVGDVLEQLLKHLGMTLQKTPAVPASLTLKPTE